MTIIEDNDRNDEDWEKALFDGCRDGSFQATAEQMAKEKGTKFTSEYLLSIKDENGLSLFHTAALFGRLGDVKNIIPETDRPTAQTLFQYKDDANNSPFHEAASFAGLDQFNGLIAENDKLTLDQLDMPNNGGYGIFELLDNKKRAAQLFQIVEKKDQVKLLRKITKSQTRTNIYTKTFVGQMKEIDGLTLADLGAYRKASQQDYEASDIKADLDNLAHNLRSKTARVVVPPSRER